MDPALQALSQIVSQARDAGAGGVEVLREDTSEVTLEATASSRSGPRRQEQAVLTVRLWREDGRRGESTGHPEDAEALIRAAMSAAAKADPEPLGGPVDRFTPAGRGLGILDPRHENLRDDDRREILDDNVRGALAEDPRIQLGTFSWSDARVDRCFVNSRGVAQRVQSTRFSVGAEVHLDDDPPIHLRDALHRRTYADVACLPWGPTLARRAVALAGTRVDVQGPVRVLLTPRPTARLVAWLADRFDHDTLSGDRSFLSRGDLQLSSRLHLLDDGSLSGGTRTIGFDDRGTLPIPLALMREGRVAAHLLTPEQARALDLRPTGHVRGGRVQPSNLVLNAGLRTINALLSDLGGQAVEVDDLPSLDGIDEKTGELDLPFDGFLRDASGHLGVVRNVRLVGNLIDALSQVAGIASDTDRVDHVDAPAMLLDGLRVEPR